MLERAPAFEGRICRWTYSWNIRLTTRKKIPGLDKDCHAFTNVVYLECDGIEHSKRKCKRVPDGIMDRMKEHVGRTTFNEARGVIRR